MYAKEKCSGHLHYVINKLFSMSLETASEFIYLLIYLFS